MHTQVILYIQFNSLLFFCFFIFWMTFQESGFPTICFSSSKNGWIGEGKESINYTHTAKSKVCCTMRPKIEKAGAVYPCYPESSLFWIVQLVLFSLLSLRSGKHLKIRYKWNFKIRQSISDRYFKTFSFLVLKILAVCVKTSKIQKRKVQKDIPFGSPVILAWSLNVGSLPLSLVLDGGVCFVNTWFCVWDRRGRHIWCGWNGSQGLKVENIWQEKLLQS